MFTHTVEECDVVDQQKLVRFRSKLSRWFDWLNGDSEHSISLQISEMLLQDAVYRCINECRRPSMDGLVPPQSGVLALFVDRGYVSGQVLAISRLVDRRPDVVSLARLVEELQQARNLFTREIFVAYDGLPYDWQAAYRTALSEHSDGPWLNVDGPSAWSTSLLRHEEFDRLMGCDASFRDRDDTLPEELFERLNAELRSDAILRIVQLRHKRIAHAATELSRADVSNSITINLVAESHRSLLRVAQCVEAGLLNGSWRGNGIPTPQRDVFENFDKPLTTSERIPELHQLWEMLDQKHEDWLGSAMDLIRTR